MKAPTPKEITVRVTRAFCMGGEPVPVDTVIKLPTHFARELMASNKAEFTNEAPRAPRGKAAAPATQKPAAPAAKE